MTRVRVQNPQVRRRADPALGLPEQPGRDQRVLLPPDEPGGDPEFFRTQIAQVDRSRQGQIGLRLEPFRKLPSPFLQVAADSVDRGAILPLPVVREAGVEPGRRLVGRERQRPGERHALAPPAVPERKLDDPPLHRVYSDGLRMAAVRGADQNDAAEARGMADPHRQRDHPAVRGSQHAVGPFHAEVAQRNRHGLRLVSGREVNPVRRKTFRRIGGPRRLECPGRSEEVDREQPPAVGIDGQIRARQLPPPARRGIQDVGADVAVRGDAPHGDE